MKKLIALLLAVAMLTAFTACSDDQTDIQAETNDSSESIEMDTEIENESAPEEEIADAPVDVLTNVWNGYDEANKFFAMGGDYTTMVDNAPGVVDMTKAEDVAALLVCPAEASAMVDDAASLIHAMNTNTFTGAAYHLANAADKDAFLTAMQDAIKNNQWICGFPEKLYIASLDDSTIIVVFGAADLIDIFSAELTEAYASTTVITEEALA